MHRSGVLIFNSIEIEIRPISFLYPICVCVCLYMGENFIALWAEGVTHSHVCDECVSVCETDNHTNNGLTLHSKQCSKGKKERMGIYIYIYCGNADAHVVAIKLL